MESAFVKKGVASSRKQKMHKSDSLSAKKSGWVKIT